MAGTEIAGLVVELSTDAKKLTTGLNAANVQIKTFASSAAKNLGMIGAGVATALVGATAAISAFVVSAANQIDDLTETAEAIGLTTRELQRLQFQAVQAGSSAEGVAQSIGFMSKAIADASSGAKPMVDAFAKLGLNAQQIINLKPDQQFKAIADGFKNIKTNAERIDLARTIFGRAGIEQINLLNSNLDETSKKFDKLGLGLSTFQVDAVKKFDDARNDMVAIWEDFKLKIAANSAPAFAGILKGLAKTIEDFGGLDEVAFKVSRNIILYMAAVAESIEKLAKPFRALGVISDAVNLAGTKIGTKAGEIVNAVTREDPAWEAFQRGEGPLPLPTTKEEFAAEKARVQALDDIANDLNDQAASKLQEGLDGFSTGLTSTGIRNVVTELDKVKAEMDKVKEATKRTGEAAKQTGEEAKEAVKQLQLLGTITDSKGNTKKIYGKPAAAATNGGGTMQPGQYTVPGQTEEQNKATQSAIEAYMKTGSLPDDSGALSLIGSGKVSQFSKSNAKAAASTGGGFGSITSESTGRQLGIGMSQGGQVQRVEVTVRPDKESFIEVAVDSPQNEQKIKSLVPNNTLDAATIDARAR